MPGALPSRSSSVAWVHPEPSPAGQPLGAEEGPCLAEPVEAPLSVKSDMGAVVRVMQLPDSGLEIRDRMWLKITIANAVIGRWSLGLLGVRAPWLRA